MWLANVGPNGFNAGMLLRNQGCLFLLACALSAPLPAATYNVAQRNSQASDDGLGTSDRPWRTLTAAAKRVAPGDTIVIRGGTYREAVVVKASGTPERPIRFVAATGENVLFTGADTLTDWRRLDPERPLYSTTWPYRFISWNPSMTHPNDEYHRVIGRCEQVIIDGCLLRQVLSTNQLAPGTFLADTDRQALLVWDIAGRDLTRTHVEASARQEILRVEGDYVQVQGLHFRYAANMAQHGAVVLAGSHDVMEDCTIESMNASGASLLGTYAVVRRCVFRDNGQLGFGASRAHDLLFTECLVENNNTKGFDRGWEAGGDKLALCRGVVLERSRFIRNRGNGIWFDIGNTNCTVRQCLIADNEDAGIFYEISFNLHAHDNVIVRNGFAATAGAWGAQAGISLSSSPFCFIERNIIAGNKEGFNFREQLRTTPTIEDRANRPVWNHDQITRQNIIAYNRDAQVWGWFDVKDNRHWPATNALPGIGGAAERSQHADIAAPYAVTTSDGQPRGLTLSLLNLRFEQNVYFAAPGQGWFAWGPTWAPHKTYSSLREFEDQLPIDKGSRCVEPGFTAFEQMDFRVSAKSMPALELCYPRGTVPGVMLGLK